MSEKPFVLPFVAADVTSIPSERVIMLRPHYRPRPDGPIEQSAHWLGLTEAQAKQLIRALQDQLQRFAGT